MSRNRARPLSPEFDLAEMQQAAVGQRGIHRQRVVAHGAVAQRTAAAGIVAGHAADGGARGGGDIDRKPQPVLFELPVEVVEHDAGLDHARAVLDVERDDAVEVFGEVDDDAVIDGLAALRGAAAARRDDPPVVAGDRERPQRLVHGPGDHDPGGHDLIERGVGGIAAAVERVEEDVARDLPRSGAPRARCFQPNPWSFRPALPPSVRSRENPLISCPPGPGLGKAKPRFLCIDGPRRAGDKPAE